MKIADQQTVHFKEKTIITGKATFHPSVKYLKWQKCQGGEFKDIDIHKPKYAGSSNDLKCPVLEIHDIDAEDEVDYRIKVQRAYAAYSNVCRLKVEHVLGEISLQFPICFQLSLLMQ